MTSLDRWVSDAARDPQARLRLFCFPCAGAGAALFHGWAEQLPPTVAVCPIHLPGRERRLKESPYTRLAPLLYVLEEVLLAHADRPFAFFGHSMGAVLGFELARRLRRHHGLHPVHLFVAARRAPQLPNPWPPLHKLAPAALVQALRELKGTPEELLRNGELMQIVLPSVRADLALSETYVHDPDDPLDCPISVFGGQQDWSVAAEELTSWREHTRGPFQVRLFPGDHFFVSGARPLLLGAVAAALAPALGNPRPSARPYGAS